MPSDDIRDLMGRYATGSLSVEEQKRLFDAALDDQELFDELAREQEMKMLLDEPGARDRLIHALAPPKRKSPWIFAVAATALLTIVLAVFLSRPGPKLVDNVAVNKPPAPLADAQSPKPEAPASSPASEPKPSHVAPVEKQKTAANQPIAEPVAKEDAARAAEAKAKMVKDAESKLADQKEADKSSRDELDRRQVAAASPPPVAKKAEALSATRAASPAASSTPAIQQQQNALGGPRQQQYRAGQGVVGGLYQVPPPFGFHYSTETAGHLVIVPAADGFLTVKSTDGALLYGLKRSAAGIIVDVALPDGTGSVFVTFADTETAVQNAPTVHTESNATIQGPGSLSIEVKLK
jgi:hypothetical protein